MLTDVLPQLAMSGAQTMRRVLNRRAGEALPDPDLKGLLRQLRLNLDFITDFRDDLSEAFRKAGSEATSLRRTCTQLAETLDVFLSEFPDLRALLARRPDDAERSEQLADLARQEARARDARRSFGDWLELLNRPFPAVDEERLRRGTAEAAAGQAENVESILARLKAGGDL